MPFPLGPALRSNVADTQYLLPLDQPFDQKDGKLNQQIARYIGEAQLQFILLPFPTRLNGQLGAERTETRFVAIGDSNKALPGHPDRASPRDAGGGEMLQVLLFIGRGPLCDLKHDPAILLTSFRCIVVCDRLSLSIASCDDHVRRQPI